MLTSKEELFIRYILTQSHYKNHKKIIYEGILANINSLERSTPLTLLLTLVVPFLGATFTLRLNN
jgi:hypothetical protein